VPSADVGIFGGSGFYELLDAAETIDVDTPYGPPAAPVTVGNLAGRTVAFLPRHGVDHRFAPHAVPYRANVWALHALGVRGIVAPAAVGSLQSHIAPGDFVVVDQLVDRTWGRDDTYHRDPGDVRHTAFADPYDAGLRAVLVAAARDAGITVHDGGTMVVIQGPRFSTRAESTWFRQQGWAVVGMTGYPEAVLAAELALPYAAVALVTDRDAGLDGGDPVTQDVVFAVMRSNVERVRALLARALPALP
jgi:5'-methylthioadenosine phosphorylase